MESLKCAKIYAKFLRENCAIGFPLFKAFQRAIKSRNPMTESRDKHRLSRVKVKLRHSGSMQDSGSIYKSPVLRLK